MDADERITLPGPPDQMDKAQWRRSVAPSVVVDRPFDPAPLMDALAETGRADRFRFAVFADTHHGAAFQDVIRAIRAGGADFAVAAGDLVDLGGGREGPANYARLAAEAGEFLRAMPVWPAIGNHDADSRWDADVWNGWANFRTFFNLQPTYAFTFANATFCVLSWMLPDEAELAWLTDQLEARRTEHCFVVAHYPLYNVTGMVGAAAEERPIERELKALLTRHRVTAHLAGHSHIYYRTVRSGVTHLICGGGGGAIAEIADASAAREGDAYYGRESGGAGYVLRAGGRVRRWDRERHFFVMIDVAGPRATARTVATDGEVWETFPLARP